MHACTRGQAMPSDTLEPVGQLRLAGAGQDADADVPLRGDAEHGLLDGGAEAGGRLGSREPLHDVAALAPELRAGLQASTPTQAPNLTASHGQPSFQCSTLRDAAVVSSVGGDDDDDAAETERRRSARVAAAVACWRVVAIVPSFNFLARRSNGTCTCRANVDVG